MRLARRRLGLSQRDLADALAWDRARVGRWEAGEVPQGFEDVVAVLRLLGFGLVVTDPEADRWKEWGDIAEHVRDRGDRRFPAHLELCGENTSSTWNWTRHRGEPSPKAAMNSFRHRTMGDRMAERERVLERRAERSGDGKGTESATPDDS